MKARGEMARAGVSVSGEILAVVVVEPSPLCWGQDERVFWVGALSDDRAMRRRMEELGAKVVKRLIGNRDDASIQSRQLKATLNSHLA